MARQIVKRQPKQTAERAKKIDCTALYIRVSTDLQAEEGFSLEAQESKLRGYCSGQGWNVCPDHVYVDAGKSGTSTVERERFNAMMQAARDGAITRIVATKLDRLSRNVRDFLQTVDELSTVGCDLVLLHEQFDTASPMSRFMLTMFAAMAELEVSTIAERMKSGKTQKAKQGGFNGSRVPLGYSYDGDQFTVNEHAATVQRVFCAFVDGASLSAIANALNADNVPTANGGKWYAATVKYLLRNGFYAGLAQWGDVETEGDQPAIVSRKVYEQAHDRLVGLKPGPEKAG